MSTWKTVAGVAGGIVVGVSALLVIGFLVVFLGCAGLIGLGQSAVRAEQTVTVTTPTGVERVPRIEIVSVDASVVEENSVFTKYGYLLEVKNNGNTTRTQTLEVELLDDNGFIIDSDYLWGETLAPGSTTLRGSILSTGGKRNAVARVNAKLR